MKLVEVGGIGGTCHFCKVHSAELLPFRQRCALLLNALDSVLTAGVLDFIFMVVAFVALGQ